MKLWRVVLCLCVCTFFAACTHLPEKNSQPVSFAAPPKLEFTGRGSAAAFMLTGSMGAAGIAIGAAIDVGLAKEAEQNFATLGYSWQQDFKARLHQAGFEVVIDAGHAITVQHIGFKTRGDEVIPWLEVEVENDIEGEQGRAYKHEASASISFDEFKYSPGKAQALLSGAIDEFIATLR